MINSYPYTRVYLEDGTRVPVAQITAVVKSFAPDYTPNFINESGRYVRVPKPDPKPLYTLYTLQGQELVIGGKDYTFLRLYTVRKKLPFRLVKDMHLVNPDLIVCTPVSPARRTEREAFDVVTHSTTSLGITLTQSEYLALRTADAHLLSLDIAQEPDTWEQVAQLNQQIQR